MKESESEAISDVLGGICYYSFVLLIYLGYFNNLCTHQLNISMFPYEYKYNEKLY